MTLEPSVEPAESSHSERYRQFNKHLDSLTIDHAQVLFSGKQGMSLTNQNIAVLDLLARYRTGAEVEHILGISETRVSQHKRAATQRISKITGLKIAGQGELVSAYVVLRHRLQKPVYRDRKLNPLNDLLKQVEPDQSAQDILDVFTSDEFKVLLPELEAGGLRAWRARLGRWYPTIWMAAFTLSIAIVGTFLTLVFLGLDVVLR